MGVGDEPRRGQVVTAEIATGDTVSGDIQFTGHSDGHGTQPVIQDPHARPGGGTTDRHGVPGDARGGRVDGAFGGSVAVRRHHVARGESLPQRGAHGFAAHGDGRGNVSTGFEEPGVEEAVHEHGHGVDVVDAVGAHVADDVVDVGAVLVGKHVQHMAFEEPGERGDGRVEGERVGQQDVPLPVARRTTGGCMGRRLCGVQVGEIGVRDGHTLRQTRGTGGVDDVAR